jgi:hypothetical protein
MEDATRNAHPDDSWQAGYDAGVGESVAVVDSLMRTSAGSHTQPLLLWLRTRMLTLLDDSKRRAA